MTCADINIATVRRNKPRYSILLLVLAAGAVAAAEPLVGVGDVAPAWELEDAQGELVRFPAAAQDAPSIILFWATWCPYCKAVMPYLEALREQYAERGVQVFAINMNDDGDPAAYLRQTGYKFRLGLHGDMIAEEYGISFTPGLLVVDGKGIVQFRRRSTRLPPGQKVAEYWAGQVRAALEKSFAE